MARSIVAAPFHILVMPAVCAGWRSMSHIRRLFVFIKPYWLPAILSLVTLTLLVFLDLAIPRLIQRIIDLGINQNDPQVVIQTAALMLAITALSAAIAIANNIPFFMSYPPY